MDPNTNGALGINQLGRAGSYRGQATPYFTSTSFSGRGFRVRQMGVFNQQANTTNAQTVTFYTTVGNAVSSTKRICQVSTTTNLASGANNWIAESTVMWDATTQAMYGEYWGNVAGNYVTRGGLVNNVAITVYTSLAFCASVIFSTSSASSTATLVEFSMEQV